MTFRLNKAAEAFIWWYAFKGIDNTGACAGKGMINHHKTFLQSDISTFVITDHLRNDTINQMETYLCLLYNRGGGGQLMPTARHKGNCICTEMKGGSAIIPNYRDIITKALPPISITHQILLRIIKWQTYTSVLRHPSLIELLKCNCKNGWANKSCGCQKTNNLSCTDICGCRNKCNNTVGLPDMPVEIDQDNHYVVF